MTKHGTLIHTYTKWSLSLIQPDHEKPINDITRKIVIFGQISKDEEGEGRAMENFSFGGLVQVNSC